MRVLYFNDQTEEFYDTPKDIYFLGSLYLKGKPYTNPKEAVDKEYVDNAFDNITSDNITEKIPASAYPAFGGDLTNKAKTNNFTLKAVGKAGRYHKPTFDSAGRITGGKTGKLTLNKNDISGIDFGKIQFLPKEDWDSITDWTKGFDRTKYLMLDDKKINFVKPISINEPNIVNENMVINENHVYTVSKEFFNGILPDKKTDGVFTTEVVVESIEGFDNRNGTPWINQRNLTPYSEDPLSTEIRRRLNPAYNLEGSEAIGNRNAQFGTFYLGGWLHYFTPYTFINEPEKQASYSIKLENGMLPENPVIVTGKFPPLIDVEGNPVVSRNGDIIRLFYYKGFIYVIHRTEITRKWECLMLEVQPDGSIAPGTQWRWTKGMGYPTYYMFEDKFVNVNNYQRESHYYNLIKGGISGSFRYLPGEVNRTPTNNFKADLNQFTIGPYLYSFYGRRGVFDSQPYGPINFNQFMRISLNNGVPFGEWSNYDIGVDINSGLFQVVVIDKLVIILRMATSSFDGEVGHNQIFYFDILDNGDIKYRNKKEFVYDFAINVKNNVVLTESSLFIMDYKTIIEMPFKGADIPHDKK